MLVHVSIKLQKLNENIWLLINLSFVNCAMDLLEIGYTKKAFGTKGEIRVHIEEQYWDYAMDTNVYFIKIRGDAVPFFIENIRDKGGVLVKFEDITGPEASEYLHGKKLYLAKKEGMEVIESTNDLAFSYCKNFTLHNKAGDPVGLILDVLEFPQQEMAIVQYENKEVYIPLHEKIITMVDSNKKEIYVDFAEDILNL
jgi:16S rRNA processing protein RimM